MLKILIPLALATASMSACATSPPSLAELDARSQINAEVSTATYTGYSVEQLRTAAFDVLTLLSPGEMHFDVRGDRLLATQTWLLTVYSGQRWYEVKFAQEGTAVHVSFAAEAISNVIGILSPTDFHSNIDVGSDADFPPNPKLFFARIDYMLGRTNVWPNCDEAAKAYGGTPVFLCGGWYGGVGIADKSPAPRS